MKILPEEQTKYMCIDHQVDIYVKIVIDKLKTREGNLENALLLIENRINSS